MSTRSCSGGTARAFNTLASAEAGISAGATVVVRAATFSSQWAPSKSGTSSAPITWKANTGETVSFTYASDAAIHLLSRSYIVLDGFAFNNPGGFMRIENSDHITVQNSTFTAGSNAIQGRSGALRIINSHYNKILNNRFPNNQAFDNIYAAQSDHNLFAGNQFLEGAQHTVLTITCGNYNIIRGNIFYNNMQKIGETFDCASPEQLEQNATHHNFWENNEFRQTAANTAKYDSNGIQFCGEENVVRRNVFYNNLGGGVSFQSYADECSYDMQNRVYNNTFYRNRCFGINAVGDANSTFTGNVLKNNLLYGNTNCSGGGSAQIELDDASATNCNGSTSCTNGNNLLTTTDPRFVNGSTAPYDLHVQTGSVAIDAGSWLTTASGNGSSSTTLVVADARYFRDALGISGEQGDLIQLQGQTQTARITAINYSTNTLTLDRALSWSSGAGVALAYNGSVPDAGAYEGTGGGTPVNQPPVAALSVSPNTGVMPVAVTASTSGSSDPDGSIASTSINFGDGSVANSASASHTYNATGSYTVTATVTDNLGAQATATKTVSVSAPANQAPTVTLTVTPTSGTAPVAVNASASGSDVDGTIASTSIDFGDGSAAVSAASASHTYNSAGSYVVTATVRDNAGATGTATRTVTVSTSGGGGGGGSAWESPIGIPEPSFGINEEVRARPNPWSSQVANYYYVNSGASNCSDSQASPNTGTPTTPRCSFPTTLPAGTVVEVHGTFTESLDGPYVRAQGTASNPVFIRGQDESTRPKWTKGLMVYGSYAIVENIDFDHSAMTAAGGGPGIGLPWGDDNSGAVTCSASVNRPSCADHIVFRHNELHGSTGTSAFGNCGALVSGGWIDNLPRGSSHNNVVFWDNYIHDEGQMSPLTDNDQACSSFGIGRYSNHVWVVDNTCYNVSQSCVQINGSGDGGTYADINFIYVGRNSSNRASKNAFWVKGATDVIFSQNVAHDTIEKSYNPSTGLGLQYGPQRVWFLYNEAYNVTGGIWMASDANGGPDQRYFLIGNVLHDITNGGSAYGSWNPSDTWSSAAIFDATGGQVRSVNNTIWNLNQANGINRPNSSGSHALVNNIIGGLKQANSRAVSYENSNEFSASTIDYNNFATFRVYNGSTGYTSPSALQGAGKCAHCISADPLFVGASTNNYQLQGTSPAINKGTTDAAYDTFLNLYGIDIRKDATLKLRPQGAAWDIGAFEF